MWTCILIGFMFSFEVISYLFMIIFQVWDGMGKMYILQTLFFPVFPRKQVIMLDECSGFYIDLHYFDNLGSAK